MRPAEAIVLVLLLFAGFAFVVVRQKAVLSFLRAYFTEPDEAINLAVLRIAFFASVLLMSRVPDASRYAALPEDLMVPPRWIGWLVALIPPDPRLVQNLRVVMLVAAFLALIGFLSRWTSAFFMLTATYVLLIPELYGKVDHGHHVLWIAAILALSPCGDALSVDQLLRKLRGRNQRTSPDAAYGMPLRTTWVMLGLIYFYPGLYKFVSGGFDWVFSDNLRFQAQLIWLSHRELPAIRIDQFPDPLLWAAAGATIAFEIGFVFAILFKKTRSAAAVVGFSFHVITGLTLGIPFASLRVVYVAFVPWATIFRWIQRRLGRTGTSEISVFRVAHRNLRVTGALMVGLLYLIAMSGFMHEHDGWPVAQYPTFPILRGEETVIVEVVLETAEGDIALIDSTSHIAAWMPSYKMFPMLFLAADQVDDPDFDHAAFWETFTCGLASAPERIRIDRYVVSTDPALSAQRNAPTVLAVFLPPTSKDPETRGQTCG